MSRIKPEVVAHYQQALGLGDWTVSVSDIAVIDPDTVAHTEYDVLGRMATIAPGPNWKPEEHNASVLHELIHLVLADLVHVVEESALPRIINEGAREAINEQIDHEVERVCERVSRALTKGSE